MAVVTGDRYLEQLVRFVEEQAGPLIEGSAVLKLNPVGFHYVQSRLEALHELESLLSGAPVDYLRAYVSDLGDYRALEQLRRILGPLTSLKVVSVLPPPVRDPTPLSFVLFGRLKVLELRGCDLSTSAAKGLLELRHTLEKIICHNSTDALRHVFASRITEIKDSPQWNRLSFASCACNNLVLMDESLQLLPVIETLDLSRNKFTKLDNLSKCTKLKHLDLGFNHLRTIESLNKVSSHIVKLDLRNNALTTLRGIENLKSLEGLDVSYNIISKFSELAYPSSLPSLQSLWLEGNPMCCARWYRPKVFSYFAYPEKLKLDDKEISNREFWKRKLIIASKHKQPSSYGFYSPAQNDAANEGNVKRKKKRASRLASIENEDENASMFSDQDSMSCENDTQNEEVPVLSDDEAEIVDLINRVELMKKERSVLWLREFKEWIEHSSDSSVNMSKNAGFKLHHLRGEDYIRNKPIKRHAGDSSRYVSDSILASGDESSVNILESDNSFADVSFGSHSHHYFDQIGPLPTDALDGTARTNSEILKSNSPGGASSAFPYARTYVSTFANPDGDLKVLDVNISSLSAIDKTSESHSTSFPSSPPHYQEDILQRRHNLVEEIMQLSAESYSVASSDSNTSGSEIDYTEFEPSMPEVDPSCKKSLLTVEEKLSSIVIEDKIHGQKYESSQGKENGSPSSASFAAQTFKQCCNSFSSSSIESATAHCARQGSCLLEENNKKAKRRVVSLKEESNMASKVDALQISKGELSMPCANLFCFVDETDKYCRCLTTKSYEFIESYFATNIADSKVNESCCQVIFCDCMLSWGSAVAERAVAVLFSSHQKFYVLLVGVADDGSGTILSLLGSHKVREVQEVALGLALQVVRLNMEGGSTYLFVMRTIERSRMLLHAMQVVDGGEGSKNCPLKSLEQVQVTLFEKLICGGSKVSILQYAMVLVKRNKTEGKIVAKLSHHLLLFEQ